MKRYRKYVSMLCLFFVLQLLLMALPSMEVNAEGMGLPEIQEMLIEDDFEGAEIDDRWTFTADGGSINQESGILNITRIENVGATSAYCNLANDTSEVSGFIGMEFTLSRLNSVPIQMRIWSEGSRDYVSAQWQADNKVGVRYRETATTADDYKHVGEFSESQLKFTFLFNTVEGSYSMWINGGLYLDNVYARHLDTVKGKNLETLRIYLEGTNYTTVKMDDLKVYKAVSPEYEDPEEPEEGLLEIKEMLVEDDFEAAEIDDRWTFIMGGGNIIQESGTLNITRSKNDGHTSAYCNLANDISEVSGFIGMEFTLSRANSVGVQIRVQSNDKLYVSGDWRADNKMGVRYRETATSADVYKTFGDFSGQEKLKFTFYFNTDKGSYSMWINGDLYLDNVYARNLDDVKAVSLDTIRIYLDGTNYTTVKIDDLKVYKTAPPAYEVILPSLWLDGVQVADFKENDLLTIKMNMKNNVDTPMNATMLVILYENDKIVNMDMISEQDISNTETEGRDFILSDFVINNIEDVTNCEIKVLLWESLASMKTLISPSTF